MDQRVTGRMNVSSIVGLLFRYAIILCGGVLFSAHFRLKIAVGAPLGEGYVAFPLVLYPLITVCAVLAALVRSGLNVHRRKIADFLAALVGVGLLAAAMFLLTPDMSQLQILYFVLGSAAIAAITLVLTPVKHSLRDLLRRLWEQRALLSLWVRYNVTSRYSQTALGILWIVMLPVATSIILTFVFSFIFHAGDIGNVPFISFFLSGLMFWTLFTQGVLNGSVSIISHLGLINQIYFPREILVIVRLGEALVDLSFVFVVTLVINLFVGILPNANFIYLPFLLAIHLAFTLGFMFFTSYLTVIIRDMQQLIAVFIQLLFYLTPLMYPIDVMPPNLAEIVKFLNPIAALINAYRDVIVYNRPPDFESLYFAIVLAGVMLYSGYMFFKANEKKLADFR
jgi:ABC-2 type transport system permease protein